MYRRSARALLLSRTRLRGSNNRNRMYHGTITQTSFASFDPSQQAATATSTFEWNDGVTNPMAVMVLIATTAGIALGLNFSVDFTKCEADTEVHRPTPASVDKDDLDSMERDIDTLPVYTMDQVSKNDGTNGNPVWMTYGGIVYDVTEFIANHPGGSEKIIMAAGSAIEPFWHLYRQHFASDLPMKLMERMAIGRLNDDDQEIINEQMASLEEEDPYAHEPDRHKSLKIHSDTPMNAETPSRLLTKSYFTPNSLFYIRNHHPVPFLSEKNLKDFRLKIDLSECGKGVTSFSLDDIKRMEKVEVAATMQCSGNRRSGFNSFQRTSGTPWGQGAISTARFGGVRLRDLLKIAGLDDAIAAQEQQGMEHVRFYGLDDLMASISIEKAASPYGDVIICYEMNGELLPRDHGFPLRVVVPGYGGVRNVKWLQKIELSKTEAEGVWQRGLNYKPLPPSITDAKEVNLEHMPSISEASLFSGITKLEPIGDDRPGPGDRVAVRVSGWAWAGGGRNIIRVDLTGDEGKTWATATLKEGSNQRYGRAWAWVFWECDVNAIVSESGTVSVASKAVDMAFNVQPETSDHTWNLRGLGNNSWYKVQVRVAEHCVA